MPGLYYFRPSLQTEPNFRSAYGPSGRGASEPGGGMDFVARAARARLRALRAFVTFGGQTKMGFGDGAVAEEAARSNWKSALVCWELGVGV